MKAIKFSQLTSAEKHVFNSLIILISFIAHYHVSGSFSRRLCHVRRYHNKFNG